MSDPRLMENPSVLRYASARRYALVLAFVSAMVALTVLVGWQFRIEAFKRLAPNMVAMNPVTAVAFLLAAISLFLATCEDSISHAATISHLCAAAVVFMGLLKLQGLVTGNDFGFDQLLYAEELGRTALEHPNRMAPNTALTFVLLGLGLLLIDIEAFGPRHVGELFTTMAGVSALLATIGYSYGVSQLYDVPMMIPMALNTALTFLMLSVGTLLARPNRGLMTIVCGDTAGGMLIRTMLPAVIILPAALGWIRLLALKMQLVDTELGLSLLVVANIVLFMTLIWWAGEKLHHIDLKRREIEVALKLVKDEAVAASHAKSAFLANMSHEIRTPMTAIVGYADFLLKPDQTASDRLNCVSTIRRNCNHLLQIVNDILDISKIEAGMLSIERIECSPCAVVNEVASMMRPRAHEKGIEFIVGNDGPIPAKVVTDPTRMRQVVTNLVSNAIKFTDHGRVEVIIRTVRQADSDRAKLQVEVVDTGPGLTDDQIRRLFRPFTQADGSTTRRFGGTGLGLSISQHLVRRLGGDISVRSTPGSGSRFSAIFDIGRIGDAEMIERCDHSTVGGDESRPSDSALMRLAGRVLLTEDGYDNRNLIGAYLRSFGMEVEFADNGRAACDMVLAEMNGSRRAFDVVLMDMQMPVMDGYTAASVLRSKGFSRPIIALTAHAMSTDRDRCLRAGCTDYLTKPLTPAQLYEMLSRHLPSSAAAETPPKTDAPPVPDANSGEVVRPTEVDPIALQFVQTFVDDLPEAVSDLVKAIDKPDPCLLRTVVHRLRGTGGMFGFMGVTRQAEAIEEQLTQEDCTIDRVRDDVTQFIAYLRRVENYDVSRERRSS